MGIIPKNDDNMENFCKAILIGMDPADAYYNVLSKNDSAKAEKLYNELKDYIRCMQEKKSPITEKEMTSIWMINANYYANMEFQKILKEEIMLGMS